jgi:hypothetical protein
VYTVELPSGATYALVAVVSPAGNRIPLVEEVVVDIGDTQVTRDLAIGLELVRSPRSELPRSETGLGRLYLQIVEDPEITRGPYVEIGLAGMEHDAFDRRELRGLVAFRPLPRIELGVRGGFAEVDGPAFDDSGIADTEAWAKLALYRASTGSVALTAGSLVTIPTADSDFGLGQDALQSKLFLSASWSTADFVVVGHAGLRTTEDGSVGGRTLDGRVAETFAMGVLVPLFDRLAVAFEARHEGERFEQAEADARAGAGLSWRPPLPRKLPGVLRAAVAFGLDDGAPDSEISLGWGVGF